MKTLTGKHSPGKVKQVYEDVLLDLNDTEAALLTDMLVWNKYILPRTQRLVFQDMYSQYKKDQ